MTKNVSLDAPEAFNSPGERLNHILDKVGFKGGHGRVAEFHLYLKETKCEDFGDLKYSTVRSWFDDHSPVMRKVNMVMEAIYKNYPSNISITTLKTWWKVGGHYPFSNNVDDKKREAESEEMAKMDFFISSIVTEECRGIFENISASDLNSLKKMATELAEAFADPFQINCPERFLRLVIKGELVNFVEDGKIRKRPE